MACHLDHSKLTGLRFCTACGQSLTASATPPPSHTQQIPVARQSAPASPNHSNNQTTFTQSELPKNNSKVIYSISGATLVLVLILGLVAVTKSPEPVTVDVSLTLLDEQCYDISWGYFDIPGADIELQVDGLTVGYASLPNYGDSTYLGCEFNATFYDIPADGSIYSYSMASGRRGVITKTREELEADGWSLGLSIG